MFQCRQPDELLATFCQYISERRVCTKPLKSFAFKFQNQFVIQFDVRLFIDNQLNIPHPIGFNNITIAIFVECGLFRHFNDFQQLVYIVVDFVVNKQFGSVMYQYSDITNASQIHPTSVVRHKLFYLYFRNNQLYVDKSVFLKIFHNSVRVVSALVIHHDGHRFDCLDTSLFTLRFHNGEVCRTLCHVTAVAFHVCKRSFSLTRCGYVFIAGINCLFVKRAFVAIRISCHAH